MTGGVKGVRRSKPKKPPCDDCWRKSRCTAECDDFKHYAGLANRGMSGKDVKNEIHR